jgi:hypothetical protein
MNPEALSNLAVAIRNAAITFFVIGLAIVGWSERQNIGAMLVGVMNRMQTAEISGVKLSFGQQAYRLNADLHKSPGEIIHINETMGSLNAMEIERLLHRPDYGKQALSDGDLHCEFDNATSTMRKFLAADAVLREKGLVEQIDRPDLLEKVRRDPDRNKDLGEPRRCYQMALSPLGADVKSVIISEISRVFGLSSYGGGDVLDAPPEKPKEAPRQVQRAGPEKN